MVRSGLLQFLYIFGRRACTKHHVSRWVRLHDRATYPATLFNICEQHHQRDAADEEGPTIPGHEWDRILFQSVLDIGGFQFPAAAANVARQVIFLFRYPAQVIQMSVPILQQHAKWTLFFTGIAVLMLTLAYIGLAASGTPDNHVSTFQVFAPVQRC